MGEKKKSTFKRTHTMSSQKTTRRSWRDEDRGMELARRSWCDGVGATKITATEATTWLNRGAESIGTLNLGFRRNWRDEDRGTKLARRRRRNGAGTTKIAVTKATTWLNRRVAESIGTLNLGKGDCVVCIA
ncbi:hypothetical protein DEO72_LG8g2571 [Vigna unguiculata]|uniref:Uncharacterized protein n=1 Tax=Vigna unguiculata TaxID=3917 RepID=A0A4D6MXC3_VIGUN|nr:hypothetical protein DEO72_LG8g2571 [Vigna unguiculata]